MSQYLGIDIGTTRTKAACYDSERRRLVAMRHAATPETSDPDGGVRDTLDVVRTVHRLVGEILEDPDVRPGDLAGVAVGSMGEETVLLDDDRRPIGPLLSWYAGHGRAAYQAAVDSGRIRLGKDTVDPTFSVFKLAWLARHRPTDLENATTWSDVADFVAWTLVGDGSAGLVVNRSHASRTGLIDVRTGEADAALADDLGLRLPGMPRLVDSGAVIGTSTGKGPLPSGVPVVTGGHDHFCGAFGAGVRSPGQAYVSAGTSEAQMVLVEHLPDTGHPGSDIGIFVSDGLRYLHRATPAGRYYRAWHLMLYDQVPDDVMWDEVGAVAADVAPMTVDVTRGLGDLRSVPLEPRRAHLMGSLTKGLAAHAEATTALLERDSGTTIDEVVVAGVPAGSAAWRRLRREATGRALRFVTEPEATVLGVALLAQRGVTGEADAPAAFVD